MKVVEFMDRMRNREILMSREPGVSGYKIFAVVPLKDRLYPYIVDVGKSLPYRIDCFNAYAMRIGIEGEMEMGIHIKPLAEYANTFKCPDMALTQIMDCIDEINDKFELEIGFNENDFYIYRDLGIEFLKYWV